MARLDRRDDALGLAEQVERGECLGVGDCLIANEPLVLEVGVFRADAGIIETGRDRVRLERLPASSCSR
jgi:hypothetical protein